MAQKTSKKPNNKILFLRTCRKDGTSYSDKAQGFRWPLKTGATVKAPDWDPAPRCGGGLHGLPWGQGISSLLTNELDTIGMVVEANAKNVVDIAGKKSKFSRCVIRFIGTLREAATWLAQQTGRAGVHYASVMAGYGGQATAGNCGKATAGNYGQAMAGNGGQAMAGDGGKATAGNGGQAMAGNCGQAMAGDGGKATAGNGGQATAGNCGQATAGNCGKATAGNYGQAMAGDGGEIHIRWYDEQATRYRTAVGYVGEDGIKPNIAYRVARGKLVEA